MKPLVSICCTTFNHEKYIGQAIDGFLSQKTTFPIEIIIHDDASTDKTVKVIKSYIKKNPKIVSIFQKTNQYSQNKKPWRHFVFPKVRGKYIALCEGDDYWTDPLKLQKQVDFLEKNEEYNVCGHCVKIYNQNLGVYYEDNTKRWVGSRDIVDIVGKCFLHTNTVVFRNNFSLPKWFCKSPVGDWPLFVLATANGKIKKFEDVMSVYRLHQGGVWTGITKLTRIRQTLKVLELFKVNKVVKGKALKNVNRLWRKYKFRLIKEKIRMYFRKLKLNN